LGATIGPALAGLLIAADWSRGASFVALGVPLLVAAALNTALVAAALNTAIPSEEQPGV